MERMTPLITLKYEGAKRLTQLLRHIKNHVPQHCLNYWAKE